MAAVVTPVIASSPAFQTASERTSLSGSLTFVRSSLMSAMRACKFTKGHIQLSNPKCVNAGLSLNEILLMKYRTSFPRNILF
tara:strand:- start:122 stop:367 length:246 start_codon:yes stop_codon:yes gene_type:complete